MINQDSIQTSEPKVSTATHTQAVHRGGWHSPAQILSWLPKTATPWQQDSAIRANYKFPEVDWQHAPNPMRTPTTKADAKIEGSLTRPMYYSHSLVQPDSIYRPEYAVYNRGVAGDPVPYTIAGDSVVTSVLIFCFVLAVIALAKSGNFLQRQFRSFFRSQREGTTVVTETSAELRFQLFLVAQTCLLFAIIVFFFSRDFAGRSIAIAHYQVLGLLTVIFMVYFSVKGGLYTLVNWVFFDNKKNEQWIKSALSLVSAEGMLLFPVVLLLAYFNLSIQTAAVYAVAVVALAKLLSFYKTYLIFFKRNIAVVQSFLYFCALELMPLGTLCGVLLMADNYIKQIY